MRILYLITPCFYSVLPILPHTLADSFRESLYGALPIACGKRFTLGVGIGRIMKFRPQKINSSLNLRKPDSRLSFNVIGIETYMLPIIVALADISA
jgi:hypothetical protein